MKYAKFILIGCCLLASAAQAQQGSIRLKNEVFREIEIATADGKKEHKMIVPEKAVPGDEMIYITTFTNVGAQPATAIEIINPVPNNSLYKNGSAFGSGTEIAFSVDGGKKYGKADELTVKDAEGNTVPAQPQDYTHIRWIYRNELQPGQESTVMFRTILQ